MPAGADIARNLDAVRRRLIAAAHRARRDPADIQLVAVSKTFPADAVRDAAGAGQRAFGENKVQEAIDKQLALADLDLEWHLIGHLQSNKAKKAGPAFAWIETLDSIGLLQKISAAAADAGARPKVLVQVDLALEETKHGADEAVLTDLVTAAAASPGVDLQGLMILPPFPERPEDSRPWFRRLRELRDRLVSGGIAPERLRHLSMGMSQDFEVAIEEGSTMVRVGTAIFGRRPPPRP